MDTAGMTEDPTAALAHLVEALSGAHVAVLGDVMLDRYIDGAVDRISPEAPIPVLAIKAETAVPGGAGNVARNLAALGARSTLIGVIGADADGAALQALLAREAGLSSRLHQMSDRPTPVKTRFMAGGHQLLRTDRERAGPVDDTAAQALLAALEAALAEGARIVVLSDYGKGSLADTVLSGAIRLATSRGARVIVDPKGSDYRRYAGADFVTPNRKELSQATGLPTGTDAEVITACAALTAASGVGAVLATRSEQGMTLALPGEAPVHLPAEAREVFDVAGAGDTVVAALAAGLAVGAAPALAAALANVAAGIVVAKRGTAVALPGEILAALEVASATADGVAKVLSREAARARAEAWRARGLTVGFTNGCFDLLHPGHVSLLRQARAACDRLIVAINSDASVKRLKGEARPIQAEASRAAVLSALESVDAVTLFGEDTPLDLIRLLRPDVLIKGADYTVDTVVGAADVQSWGGRVVLAELVEGQSTTAIARRMAAS